MNRAETPTSKPCCIDKSAAASCCRWWTSEAADAGVSQLHDVATPNRLVPAGDNDDVTRSAGSRCDGHSTGQNGNCGDVEAEADDDTADGGQVAPDRTGAPNNIRNRDVTAASADKRAKIVRDRRLEDRTSPQNNPITATSPTRSQSRSPADRLLERSHYTTTTPSVAARPHPIHRNNEKSQNSPDGTIGAGTGKTVAAITAGDCRFAAVTRTDGEYSQHNSTRSSSTQADTAATGSNLSTGGKRIRSEDKFDQAAANSVAPSVNATAAKSSKNYAANRPRYAHATKVINSEITVTQPNVLFPFVTGNNRTVAENVIPERNFDCSTAKRDSVQPINDGSVCAGGSTTHNNERITHRKSPSAAARLASSSFQQRKDVTPTVARIVETLSSGTKKLSADAGSGGTPTKDTDDAMRAKVDETSVTCCTLNAMTAAVLTGVKQTDVHGENQNTVQPNRAANSTATKRIAATAGLPRRDASFTESPATSVDGDAAPAKADTATAATGAWTGRRSVADPVAVKLVRVDRMLRSVPPVAPTSIRRTGVATPAVQAVRHLANTSETPRAAPRTSIRPIDGVQQIVEQSNVAKNDRTSADVGDGTPALNRSSNIRNHDVTASADKRAEIVRDGRSEDRTTSQGPTSPTQPKSKSPVMS